MSRCRRARTSRPELRARPRRRSSPANCRRRAPSPRRGDRAAPPSAGRHRTRGPRAPAYPPAAAARRGPRTVARVRRRSGCTARDPTRRWSSGGLLLLLLLLLLADDVEGAAGFEPFDLFGAERLGAGEVDGGAVGVGDPPRDGLIRGQVRESEDADAVVLADLVVGPRVGEGQRQQALFLQVGLVDPGEGPGEDHHPTPEPRFHGGMLAGRALPIVLVADGAPPHPRFAEMPGDLREWSGGAVEGVDAVA